MTKFSSVSKSVWLDKIQKDLKGKSLSDCYTSLDENLLLDPFATVEDLAQLDLGPIPSATESWIAMLDVNAKSGNVNAMVLEALAAGAEGLRLDLEKDQDLSQIYEGVFVNMIYNDLQLSHSDQITQFLSLPNTTDKGQMKGFISCEGVDPESINHSVFGNFHNYDLKEEQSEQLILPITNLFQALIVLLEKGVNPTKIRISLNVDDRMLRNIIKIRAVKMLWHNLLAHYNLDQIPAYINVDTDAHLSVMDEGLKLISAAHIASALVIAGVDQFSLFKMETDREKARLGLNIHHLLKTEAKLDKIVDPLNGCYPIEKACVELSNKVWDNF